MEQVAAVWKRRKKVEVGRRGFRSEVKEGGRVCGSVEAEEVGGRRSGGK